MHGLRYGQSVLRASVLVGLLAAVAFTPRPALGNGRVPATIQLHFRPGNEADMMLAATIGALRSTDGGATWRWYCEAAVGYGGKYDPDYAFTATGAIFATTFSGLRLNRDGCTFAPTPLGELFVSQVEVSPDGSVLVAAADVGRSNVDPPEPADSRIYRSADNGVTFQVLSNPGQAGDWWDSLRVSPSDSQRVYLSGYRFPTGGGPKVLLLFRSNDGGTQFAPLPLGDFAVSPQSDVTFMAVAPTDPNRIFARVSRWNGATIGDALYRSTDGGNTWAKVLELGDVISAVVVRRGSPAVLVTTLGSGWHRSADGGATFVADPSAPRAQCLTERVGGELWLCSDNSSVDRLALGKGTDGRTWARVMALDEIAAPVRCADGTVQKDSCEDQVWCGLDRQLGINGTEINCSTRPDASPAPDASGTGPGDGGCCGAGTNPAGIALVVGGVCFALRRRRRRR